QAVEAGETGDRSVLVADHQTNGRGRLDRVWDAPPGVNLLVSIAFIPVPPVAVELTHRVGLATVAAIRALVPGAAVGLKWPNDVLLGDR
ncbi:MAG: biotin--[acetyl-CoA-carboxylase] ligase, partial [Actinobacteria bacterium]